MFFDIQSNNKVTSLSSEERKKKKRQGLKKMFDKRIIQKGMKIYFLTK